MSHIKNQTIRVNNKNKTNSSIASENKKNQPTGSSKGTSQKTSIEDDVSVLLSSLKKILRNLSNTNQ
jgi:hypothetical protein